MKTYIQIKKEDGTTELVLKDSLTKEQKSSFIHTRPKTTKVFHHEAGKGSRRR